MAIHIAHTKFIHVLTPRFSRYDDDDVDVSTIHVTMNPRTTRTSIATSIRFARSIIVFFPPFFLLPSFNCNDFQISPVVLLRTSLSLSLSLFSPVDNTVCAEIEEEKIKRKTVSLFLEFCKDQRERKRERENNNI